MLDWGAFEERVRLKEIFNRSLNDSAFLRQSFPAKAIDELRVITHGFYDRILKDARIKPFHGVIADPQRRIRFEKNLARFCLYVLVLDYRQMLVYFVRAMATHKRLKIPFDLVYEYFLYLSARFEPWAAEHFKLDAKDQMFYHRKMDSLAYLFLKSYDDRFLTALENDLDEPVKGTPAKMQAIEVGIFTLLENDPAPALFDELITAIKRYVAHMEMSKQKGAQKIATVIARFVLQMEINKNILIANPGSRVLIADFVEKCSLYTADPEFAQASLALYYLDLQIEASLFRVFTGVKAPPEAAG